MRIGAIIQARMNSSRLPGKILMPIGDKPMLQRVVERVAKAKQLTHVIVATTDTEADNETVLFLSKPPLTTLPKFLGRFYRGSEQDTLDRYYMAAKAHQLDIIVRITADCPLIDPEIIDRHVLAMLEHYNAVDYVTNALDRTYPQGLDVQVWPMDVLTRMWRMAKRPYAREHPGTFIVDCEDLFNTHHIINSVDLSHLRWTVDEQADLAFMNALHSHLPDIYPYNHQYILNILEKYPEISNINKHVMQIT